MEIGMGQAEAATSQPCCRTCCRNFCVSLIAVVYFLALVIFVPLLVVLTIVFFLLLLPFIIISTICCPRALDGLVARLFLHEPAQEFSFESHVSQEMGVAPLGLPECSICQLQFIEEQSVILMNCRHQFHEPCIKEWTTHRGQLHCPLCNQLRERISRTKFHPK